VLHASNVSAGNGSVIDWRSVKSGESLLENADAFDTAIAFQAAVGTWAALDSIGAAPFFDRSGWERKKLEILHNRNPWVRP